MHRSYYSSMSRRLVLSLLGAALAALLLVGCGDEDAPATNEAGATPAGAATFPRTITDSSNTKVTIAAPPKRIVSLSPAATEILFAIGAGDRVVGTDKFSNYPEAATKTSKVDYSKPDPEAVLALNPDLVIMVTRQEEQVKQFRDLKLTVLYFEEAATVDGVFDSIALFGDLTGQDTQARQLVASMRTRVDAITSKLGGVTKGPRVFYEITSDLYTASPETFIGSMLTLLKAQNVAAGATSDFPQLTAEAVIAADPEVIFLADAEFLSQGPETVAARPGWANMSAVKYRRIYPIDDDVASRPGPRIVEAMEIAAKALYPDRFQ